MAEYERDSQRGGFNDAAGIVRLLAYPGSLYETDNGPIQVFQTLTLQSQIDQDMGIEPPPVGFNMSFTTEQLQDLQRLDNSGRSGVGTDVLGQNAQILRNDEHGITLSTLHRLPTGGLLAAEITFLSEDISERLTYMDTLSNPPPVLERGPYVEEPLPLPPPMRI